MPLEEIKVGQEYYTANDEFWAHGRLGGRMRVLGIEEARYGSGYGQEIRCDRLAVATGDTIARDVVVFQNGFRGPWSEVGEPIRARQAADEERAERMHREYGNALTAMVATINAAGVPARVAEHRGQFFVESFTPRHIAISAKVTA